MFASLSITSLVSLLSSLSAFAFARLEFPRREVICFAARRANEQHLAASNHLGSAAQRLEVNIDRILELAGVAASHSNRYWQASLAAVFEHHSIARGQALLGKR